MAKNANNSASRNDANKTNNNINKVEKTENNTLNIEQLTAMMASMQKQMNEQAELIKKYEAEKEEVKNKPVKISSHKIESKPANSIKIDGDTEITVTNNVDGEFLLSTLGYGNGKVYEFHGLGYQMDIPYSDLKEIIHNNLSFFEGGRVYIEDESVVQKHKLEKFYEHMLNATDFDSLRDMNGKEFFDLLLQLPKAETNTLNKGNEPHQIDLVLDYVLNRSKEDQFPIELYTQLEKAYEKIKGRKIDITETIDNYHTIFPNSKKGE